MKFTTATKTILYDLDGVVLMMLWIYSAVTVIICLTLIVGEYAVWRRRRPEKKEIETEVIKELVNNACDRIN